VKDTLESDMANTETIDLDTSEFEEPDDLREFFVD
jgi:hypothetical protein